MPDAEVLAAPFAVQSVTGATTASVEQQLCTSVEALAALREEWRELFSRCASPTMFQSPDWHLAWWRAFGARRVPHVLALRKQGRLVAVLPLLTYDDIIRGLRVRVLGSYNNDHASRSGILVEPGYEAESMQALAAHLDEVSARWDVLMLTQLPADAPWLPHLIEACGQNGLNVFGPKAGTPKSVLSLEGSWDDYLKRQSRHFRVRMKENQRRLEKAGVLSFRRSSGAPEDFDIFLSLEQSSWKSEDDYARLGVEGWNFQRELALTPGNGITCHNIFLEIDGKVLGGMHALSVGDVAYSMQTLFDESVRKLYPGRVQFAKHLEDMFGDARLKLLDLNGNSLFCKSWTEDELQFVGLQVYSRRPYSRLLAFLKRWLGRNK